MNIDRRENLAPEAFLQSYSRVGRPVILKGAAKWRALSEWDMAFFKREFPNKEFSIGDRKCRLADLIDQVIKSTEESPAPYLKNINIGADFPELVPYIKPDLPFTFPNRLETPFVPRKILFRGQGRYVQLFIGGAGRTFPNLHWDAPPFQTYSTCVFGRKEWVLFPPDQGPLLYINPKVPSLSLVNDVYNPDLQRFPLFAQAKRISLVQQRGETLFVPHGWWHTAKNLEPTISVASDQLSAETWRPFVKFLMQTFRRKFPACGPLVPWAAWVYLHGVGLLLSAAEAMGYRGRSIPTVKTG